MNQHLVLLILLSLGGCSIVGEKDALVVTSSDWKTKKLYSKVTYHFQCDDLWIKLDEIVFESKTSSYGPILPIIPSGRHIDKTNDNLELRFRFVGKSGTKNHVEEDFTLTVKPNNEELGPAVNTSLYRIAEKPFEGAFWIQYRLSYTFSTKLRDINNLSIELVLPFDRCKPPILHLEKETVNDSEFILAPGI